MIALEPQAPLIAHGPNAGQKRPTADVLLDRLHASIAALIVLKRNGHAVIGLGLEGIAARIWIENSDRCAELPDACTVKWGCDHFGAYQVKETKLGAVRVCWIVRGH